MNRRRLAAAGGAVVAAGALAWGGWAVERSAARRLRADEHELVEAGLSMPPEVIDHFIVASDGARLHAVEAGEGPTVVLIHGVTLGATIFIPVIRHLMGTMRVIAIDLRGHGTSLVGDDGVSLERQAADLAEILEYLEVTHAVVVGHSMGGMIAQVLMASPDEALAHRVAHLILLSTSAGPLTIARGGRRIASGLRRLAHRSLRRSVRRGHGIYPSEDAATWLTRASFGRSPEPPAVELARSLTQAASPALVAKLLEPVLSFDGREALASIEVPTTVVVGSRDLLTPPRMARLLHRGIAGSGMVTIKGAGHVVMLEAPEALCDLIEAAVTSSVQ